MVIRCQLSGICCAHASATYQHYIISHRSRLEETSPKMLDISYFIRENLPPEKQKQFILHGVISGGSFDLLKLFTNTKDDDYFTISLAKPLDSKFTSKFIYESFVKTKEPFLVCCFKVDGHFSKRTVLEGTLDKDSYNEILEKRGGKAQLHAMIMIGAYHSHDDGRYWFVLQNSHKDDYFKLVDGEYLASCSATIRWADESADMSLKGSYDTVVGEYVEAAFDMEECYPTDPAEGQN